MDLASAGSFLQGAGSLLGGLGFGSKEKKGPSLQEQYAAQQGHERDSFNQKMALAKQHGIHPLAMMGIPMSTFAPSIVPESSSGVDFAQLGYGANQIASNFVKPPDDKPVVDPRADALADANLRLAKAQASRAEWDALHAQFQVEDMARQSLVGQPGNPPGARVSNDVSAMRSLAAAQSGLDPAVFGGASPLSMKQEVLPPHPRKLGYGAGTDQAFVTTMDATGKPGTVLNQNAIQAEFEDGATMTLLTRLYGVDRATEIMAVLEQKGLIGGVLAAGAAAGKLFYDRMAKQRRGAFQKRKTLSTKKSDFQKRMKARGGVFVPGYGWYLNPMKGGDR